MDAEKLVLTNFVTRQDPHGVPIIPGQTANAKKKVSSCSHRILVILPFFPPLSLILALPEHQYWEFQTLRLYIKGITIEWAGAY